ncbi:hypothetical protein BD410DRAFT_810244 [Rickenella mellea]|uniref:BTB domain-containing protein n=1 Tax=Rickenella mellea TaxID=50990 RepID=A0A4Y7PGX5_9AGAM|nr:hypothetical protein BD410DRAFT_810244 [Rickenella mellea]
MAKENPSQIPTIEDVNNGKLRSREVPLIKRDEMYYIPSLVFLVANDKVEDYLFKMPRPYFELSGVFTDAFNLPSGDRVVDGVRDEVPLRLDGIKACDFRALLKVLIPLPSIDEAKIELNKKEWLGVLHLSDMWKFKASRRLSIDKLGKLPMNAVERILLGRKYNIDEWLMAAHLHLARRQAFLRLWEAEELGGTRFTIKDGERPIQNSDHKHEGRDHHFHNFSSPNIRNPQRHHINSGLSDQGIEYGVAVYLFLESVGACGDLDVGWDAGCQWTHGTD